MLSLQPFADTDNRNAVEDQIEANRQS